MSLNWSNCARSARKAFSLRVRLLELRRRLARLVEVSPGEVSAVLRSFIDAHGPFYDYENRMRSLVKRLADLGFKPDALSYLRKAKRHARNGGSVWRAYRPLSLSRSGNCVAQRERRSSRAATEESLQRRATHIVMEPLEFMEHLAALVPRPRLHLIRFHGVLAPNAKLRSKIVPAPAGAPLKPRARTLTRTARPRAHELGPAGPIDPIALRTQNPLNPIYSHVALDDTTEVSLLISQAHWTAGREYLLRCWRLLDLAETLRRGRHPVRWL